jgi:hypothetical protein
MTVEGGRGAGTASGTGLALAADGETGSAMGACAATGGKGAGTGIGRRSLGPEEAGSWSECRTALTTGRAATMSIAEITINTTMIKRGDERAAFMGTLLLDH